MVTRIESAIKYTEIALGAFPNIEGTFDRTPFDVWVITQAAGRHGIEPDICRWDSSMLKAET
jgi:hypothetical protein